MLASLMALLHQCQWVCCLYLFFQVTESHAKCPAWPGDAVLSLSVVHGEIYGVPVSQLSCTAPTRGSGTQHKVILCGWRKDNRILISIVNLSLWPGAYWFLQGQHLINLLLERRCVCAIFSSIAVSKGRKAKDSLGTIKHFSLVSCLDWVFEAIDL